MDTDDIEKIVAAAAETSKQKSLELLFDYTKFHIGVYLTLTGSYLAFASLKIGEKHAVFVEKHMMWTAVVSFMTAGFAGGVIASSITQTQAHSSREFLETMIGPWDVGWLRLKAKAWTWIEHTAFWVGLILAAGSAHDAVGATVKEGPTPCQAARILAPSRSYRQPLLQNAMLPPLPNQEACIQDHPASHARPA